MKPTARTFYRIFLSITVLCALEAVGLCQSPPAAATILPNSTEAPIPPPPVSSGSACGQAPCNSGAMPFPGPAFDPYSTSNNYNYSPYNSGSPNSGYPYNINSPAGAPAVDNRSSSQKLLDAWDVNFLWMSGGEEGKKLSLTRLELNATFAFPLCFDPVNSLKVTPGFVFNWWNTDHDLYVPTQNDNYYYFKSMPTRTYDAYCDVAWAPHINDWISADLAVRIGVYSDFHSVKGGAIRVSGHGYGVFQISQTMQIKLGIDYINRVNVKLLPAGGVVWTNPEKTMKLEAIFPYPKFSRKCEMVDAKTELWWYVRGEYGGGTWNVYTGCPEPYDDYCNVSYDDVRIAAGLDFEFANNIHGFFEIGGAFNRKVVYQNLVTGSLGDSFFLAGGLRY